MSNISDSGHTRSYKNSFLGFNVLMLVLFKKKKAIFYIKIIRSTVLFIILSADISASINKHNRSSISVFLCIVYPLNALFLLFIERIGPQTISVPASGDS